MSMVICDHCDRAIDTDFDAEAWIEEEEMWLCPRCRDAFADEIAELREGE